MGAGAGAIGAGAGGGLAGGKGWSGVSRWGSGVRRGGGACGCDDGCGAGNGAGCGTGYDTTGVLSYVGAGGDYRQETTYKYVGQGAGDFATIPVPTGYRCNIWLLIIPLLLLLVPFLLFLLSRLSATPVTTTTLPPPPPPPVPTTEPYDCNAAGAWSQEHADWCCEHYGKGCPTKAPKPVKPASTTSPCPFDCNAGYNEWPMQWVKGWTGAKKMYCCKTAGRGCATELPPPSGLPPSGIPGEADTGPYDCNAGYHPCYHCLKQQWSPHKLSWCCTNQNKGCQSNTPP